MHGDVFRLDSAIVGIRADNDGSRLITIPSGSTVSLIDKTERNGLVDVSYEGMSVAVFLRDLRDRCSPLPMPPAEALPVN